MRIAVIIATIGRPEEVAQLLDCLARQSKAPSVVVLSVESAIDLPQGLTDDIQIVMGPRGSSVQRNRGIDLVKDNCDIIAFFDDDFLPTDESLGGMVAMFKDHPDVVGATGLVLADGISCGGITYATALQIIAKYGGLRSHYRIQRDVRGAYGCNMAFRSASIGELRFDENLPLYGWQEDLDFAARMATRGRVVKTDAFVGVHRGVTRSRTSGVRFGFSQIVNPTYLVCKGTMHPLNAVQLMLRNLIANHLRALWPEPWIDRLGRVKGNWLGLAKVLRGQIVPQEVTRL